MLNSFVIFEDEADFKQWFNSHTDKIIKGTVRPRIANGNVERIGLQMVCDGILFTRKISNFSIRLYNIPSTVLDELDEPTLESPKFSHNTDFTGMEYKGEPTTNINPSEPS